MEGKRYSELKILLNSGVISNLILQPVFKLQAGRKYRADFTYTDEKGRIIVEDVKGCETEVFKIKADLFEEKYKVIRLKNTPKGSIRWELQEVL